ncbi:MAG: hypothetical protein ACREJ3_16310 [Polyangiaceae bacterium]
MRGETSALGLLYTLLALLALAGLSLVLRFSHIGALGYAAALGIAAVMACLVGVFSMEILSERASARFAMILGGLLIGLLVSLMVADVLTRSVPPLSPPPGMAQRDHG